ncbi:hypothetical protein B0H13DRAFT_2320382 [Mycena leptocephala]|nr:hypothetical protein B0H13DRAFT_2359413 [Mycena leptocephala]KAJ7919569.1 hypothetical protein B0H13DRAFT_2320382 [Mycena leptocephala]
MAPGSSFLVSQVNLLNAARTFGGDSYSTFPLIFRSHAGHLKSCSAAYDVAIAQLASLTPAASGGAPVFSLSDGAILNATYILPTNGIILGRLDNLQAGKAFFESTPIGANDEFLGTLTSSEFAPSADYSAYWSDVQSNAAFQYHIWLREDGFNCGGS